MPDFAAGLERLRCAAAAFAPDAAVPEHLLHLRRPAAFACGQDERLRRMFSRLLLFAVLPNEIEQAVAHFPFRPRRVTRGNKGLWMAHS